MLNTVIIPGIGGHPAFHRSVAATAERFGKVHSWPHGDFCGEPFTSIEQHRQYWSDLLNRARLPELVIIAISFGAHIAIGLPQRLETEALTIVLVSYWPICKFERSLLDAMSRLPEAFIAPIIGSSLMAWSGAVMKDRTQLRELRSELYDSRQKVQRRLRARLLCLLDNEPAFNGSTIRAKQPLAFLYGNRELAFCLHHSFVAEIRHLPNVTVSVVRGGHSISITPSSPLNSLLTSILEGLDEGPRSTT